MPIVVTMFLFNKMCDEDSSLKKEVIYLKTIIKHQDLIIRELQEKTWLQDKNQCEMIAKTSNHIINTQPLRTQPYERNESEILAVSKAPTTATKGSEFEAKSKQGISSKELNAAVEVAKTTTVIENMQNLVNENRYHRENEYTSSSSDEWKKVQHKRKRRKFLVHSTKYF
ncbi:hypothetical protein JTB14_018825 [Gonioctena quinquepunctata]|nr:hypothetical protein JTB14_018825 [Gonioctena quinquepunctata]